MAKRRTPRRSPLRARLRYGFIAGFFNQTLPSTVGGDAVRIWLLGRDQGGWRVATYSVLIDRMVGVLVLASLVIVCLPWSFALIGNAAGRTALLLVGFGSIGACAVFIALGFLHWRWLERWWVTRQLAAAAAMARRVFASASSAVPIVVYSLIIHAMSASAAWCLAKSVAAPLAWSEALLLVLPVLLIATIPLSIAGWGTRETAMVLAFGYAGLPESTGLIVSVLLGIATFAAGLVGGVIWILDRGKRMREARQAVAVIVAVPGDEARDALGDRRRRLEADVAHEIVHVGEGGRNVAGLYRREFADRLLAERLLEQGDHVEQLDRIVVADIVDAPRRRTRGRIGSIARPIGIGRGRFVDEPHHRLHDVVDIGEIAPHLAVVEQPDRFAGVDRGGENPHRHVRAAPRTVDGEKPQARGRQIEQMRIGMRHQLVRFLRGAVQAERMIDIVGGAERHFGVGAVDRR